jgi:hypothetical protein
VVVLNWEISLLRDFIKVVSRLGPIMIAAISLAITSGWIISNFSFKNDNLMTTFVSVLVGSLITTLLFYISRFLYKNPTLVTMSILGFPSTGKTVYLTIAFDELQRAHDKEISFSPYSTETVEQVMNNINILNKGRWLNPTELGSIFPFRANASIGSGLFMKRYKIEIADYAGQKLGELLPENAMWLHKTDYFKYVVQSDVVFFAFDCALFNSAEESMIEEIQNAFVAALQILAESKGATENLKLKIPIAVIFLKADLIIDSSLTKVSPDLAKKRERYYINVVSRMFEVFENRCEHFSYYFISSVGKLGSEGEPPKNLSPVNVVNPIKWALRNL